MSGAEIQYMENGFCKLVEQNALFPMSTCNIFEVESIPEDIDIRDYCYTEADGFYQVPEEPETPSYDIPEEVVTKIKDECVVEIQKGVMK